MKLYVLPVESLCNADCGFCITKFRKVSDQEFLNIGVLEKVLEKYDFDSIEITGGGEPPLHKQIGKIIDVCVRKAKTQMYTNGVFAKKILDKKDLAYLCLSRAHHDSGLNQRIMKIKYDEESIFESGIPIKLSLLVHNSGINSVDEVKDYLDWAKEKGAKKVVVRQMFEHDYKNNLNGEYVSTEKLARNFGKFRGDENPTFYWREMPVEFEFRSCACEMDNPVLHADGKLYKGWSREVLDDFNRPGN